MAEGEIKELKRGSGCKMTRSLSPAKLWDHSRVYPTKKKRDAHHGLSLMAAQDGVPPHLIMDGSKEQTLGEF